MLIPDLQIDHDSRVPVYRQIAEGVRAAAVDGRLAPGHRLPPTRDLARQLGVNRQTVVAAYDALASDGWVHGQTGKGTYLRDPADVTRDAPAEPAAVSEEGWLPTFSRAVEGPKVGSLLSVYQAAIDSGGISFAGSYPARELLPVDAFTQALRRTLGREGGFLLGYGPTAGHPRLRQTLAARMRADGSDVSADDVLITNGAQQAIELVFHTFLERGDAVVIEEPTYAGALSVLSSLGARVVSVPVDEQGIRPDLLSIALERERPRLLYVQPTLQNPTTAVMGEERRRELVELARRNRCVIVEDDWGLDLRVGVRELPTLHALAPDQVIYVSTFSKKLLPGLRVGWAAAPPEVMPRLVALKQIRDCGTSPLLQAALDEFLAQGSLESHLDRVRQAYADRRDCMLAALTRHFPAEASWRSPEGGLFVWVTLPRGIDGDALFRSARERGVTYSRGELFHASADGGHTLRLTYSAVSTEEIESGVAILGELIREQWPGGSAATRKASETMPIL